MQRFAYLINPSQQNTEKVNKQMSLRKLLTQFEFDGSNISLKNNKKNKNWSTCSSLTIVHKPLRTETSRFTKVQGFLSHSFCFMMDKCFQKGPDCR